MNRKVNILLVDDEPGNLLALEAILECLGQNLVKASSGEEALRRLLEQDFALILLDVQMGGMNGVETAIAIRERERARHIPIIFLTGVVKTEEMMFKGYSAAARLIISMKPVVTGILRAKVEVFIELAVARQKLQEEIAERARIATEIAKLNMVLEQKNEDLLAANADLEAFGSSVSHDLQAPLRHIQGYAGFLQESAAKKLDKDELRQLEIISASASRMGRLISDLLGFSRTGRLQLRKERLNMDQLLRETVSQLQPDLAGRNIDWKISPLPEVRGDHNLLRQIWVNLAGNAVKYSRSRNPATIEIGSVVQDNEIIFHIRDNGVGFNMQYSDKLFGVFQRLHSAEQFEGTGIGLANVRRIVQRHGGRTWAEGREGAGATFYFSLPAE